MEEKSLLNYEQALFIYKRIIDLPYKQKKRNPLCELRWIIKEPSFRVLASTSLINCHPFLNLVP